MKKINLLMVVITWVFTHMLIYNIHRYLMGIYGEHVPFMAALFLLAVFAHYRLATYMASKVSTYL